MHTEVVGHDGRKWTVTMTVTMDKMPQKGIRRRISFDGKWTLHGLRVRETGRFRSERDRLAQLYTALYMTVLISDNKKKVLSINADAIELLPQEAQDRLRHMAT